MLNDRVKITNVSNHVHGIKEVFQGREKWKKMQPKSSAYVSIDTFLSLWTETKDFKRGILSVDVEKFIKDFGEETAIEFGMNLEELKDDIFMYSDEQIIKLLKGKMGDFNGFIGEVRDIEGNDKHSFMKRVFDLAKSIENLNISKAQKIEKDFGMKFDIEE